AACSWRVRISLIFFERDRLSRKSRFSSPGTPKMYSTPSSSRHATNRSDALVIALVPRPNRELGPFAQLCEGASVRPSPKPALNWLIHRRIGCYDRGGDWLSCAGQASGAAARHFAGGKPWLQTTTSISNASSPA